MKKALVLVAASATLASAAFAASGGSTPAKKPAPAPVVKSTKAPAVPAAKAPALVLKSDKDKVSYLIGYSIGMRLKQDVSGPGDIDVALLAKGLGAAIGGEKLAMTDEEAGKVMQGFQRGVQARHQAAAKALADKNRKEGDAYLAANRKKEGVTVTASGLQYKVLRPGEGSSPKESDTVTVHYRGTLVDGTEFDSSYGRGEPATFPVNGVIPGWTEVLQLMKPGAKWQVAIPSQLAYGEEGTPGRIGPNSTLLFDIELISIAPPETPAQPEAPAPPQTPAQPMK